MQNDDNQKQISNMPPQDDAQSSSVPGQSQDDLEKAVHDLMNEFEGMNPPIFKQGVHLTACPIKEPGLVTLLHPSCV